MTIFLGLVWVLVLQIFQSIYIQSNIVHDYYKAYYISNAGIEISLVKHKIRDYQPFEDTDKYETEIKKVKYSTNISVKNLQNKICKTLKPNESTNIYMYYYESDIGWQAGISRPQEKYKDVENSVSFSDVDPLSFEYTIWSYYKDSKELIDTSFWSWINGNNDWLFAKPLTNTTIIDTTTIDAQSIPWIHKISIANIWSNNESFCLISDWLPSDTLNISSIWKYKNSTIKLTAIKKMNDL